MLLATCRQRRLCVKFAWACAPLEVLYPCHPDRNPAWAPELLLSRAINNAMQPKCRSPACYFLNLEYTTITIANSKKRMMAPMMSLLVVIRRDIDAST